MKPDETTDKQWDEQLLKDPHAAADKRGRVQRMFAAIAPSYDLNNRLHSLWQDQRWRRKAVKLAGLKPTDVVVDVACGTGDLALAFVDGLVRAAGGRKMFRHSSIPTSSSTGWSVDGDDVPHRAIGIDFTFPMLPIARSKTPRIHYHGADDDGLWDGWHHPIRWINGDAMALPLSDECCDVVSIAFGIRNVVDPAKALSEFYRVLRPGGRVIVLEFSLPANRLLRGLYNFYFRRVLPRTATWISGDRTGAYRYLPESVNTFIGREKMMQMMAEAGFTNVEQFPMTFGVCVCYRGVKG
jgi:demethylmenaquinone methyltransferase / 2-methoxy-6-polyprenyl-1,4-benzoquinol methylase